MMLPTLQVRMRTADLQVSCGSVTYTLADDGSGLIAPHQHHVAASLMQFLQSTHIGGIDLFAPDSLSDSPQRPALCVGLVAIGLPPRAAGGLKCQHMLAIQAGIDVTGAEVEPLAQDALITRLSEFIASHRLEAAAVSGINSLMNPLHEAQAAAAFRRLTGLPVIEGRYLRQQGSAIQRLISAGDTAMRMLRILKIIGWFRTALGQHVPFLRLLEADKALLAAVTCCGPFPMLAGTGLTLPDAVIEVPARITRPASRVYACHCDDARYEMDSLTSARRFAQSHVREQAEHRARLAGLRDPVVEVSAEDRFTRIRGIKGPVRVYLETHLLARARAADAPTFRQNESRGGETG